MEENKKAAPNQPEEINEDQLDNVAGGSRYVRFPGGDINSCPKCDTKMYFNTSNGDWYCPKCQPERA